MIHGWYPLEEMPRFYELAVACMITQKGDRMIGQTTPSKLRGYMSAGRTVIGAINGTTQDIKKESKCGVGVDASDYKALALVMKDFIENQSKYSDCGQNDRDYFIKNFTKEMFMGKLINQFEEILEGNQFV
jgi:glycosyltransferase involved in cell wall biosynthesis